MKSRLGPEFQKIEEMTRHLPTATSNVVVGIGDDAAVLRPPTGSLLFCSDLMIEGVHFRRDWASPQEIAMKALSRALSDIAAMNGRPLYATISLALASDLPENYHVELYKGFARTAAEHAVEIIGGDLSRSPSATFIDVSIIGEVREGSETKPYLRKGARPGDLLIVTGELGGSAAGLHSLEQGLKDDPRWTLLRRLHLQPQPRFDALKKLDLTATGDASSSLVTSMIDISDSLSSEVHHLAHSSQVGFEILEDAIPIHPAVREYADRFELKAIDLALYGGEDHQLLFTADALLWEQLASSQPETIDSMFSVIGITTPADSNVILVDKNDNLHELKPRGWDHFKQLQKL